MHEFLAFISHILDVIIQYNTILIWNLVMIYIIIWYK